MPSHEAVWENCYAERDLCCGKTDREDEERQRKTGNKQRREKRKRNTLRRVKKILWFRRRRRLDKVEKNELRHIFAMQLVSSSTLENVCYGVKHSICLWHTTHVNDPIGIIVKRADNDTLQLLSKKISWPRER